MDGDAVREIAALAEGAAGVSTVEIDGVTYAVLNKGDQGQTLEDPRKPDPEPKVLTVHTLSGLIDFVKTLGVALGENARPYAYHVVSHKTVVVVSQALVGRFRQREAYGCAVWEELLGSSSFAWGTFYSPEAFIISLQTLFEMTEDLATVMKVVGTLKAENVKQTEDDGVTQTATARSGVVSSAEVKVPNPVTLQPFRTFREVSQPESKFVLRLRNGKEGEQPSCALFEADGGMWKLTAIQSIASYIRQQHPEATVLA